MTDGYFLGILTFMRKIGCAGLITALLAGTSVWAEPVKSARLPQLDRRPGAVIYRLKTGASAANEKSLNTLRRNRATRERRDLGAGLTFERFDTDGTNEEFLADELVASGVVEFATPDYLAAHALIPNDSLYGVSWHHPKIKTPSAWDTSTGTGVTIAILDTGVDSDHPDLSAQMVAGRNVVGNNNDTHDVHGHGTWVAGVAAATANNAAGIAGVAWNAKIMPIRIANESGYAFWSDMATGIVYAADHGARVANLSYASSCGANPIIDAARYLRSKKGVLVVAAGNESEEVFDTASADVTCVSATDSSDAIASFSNYGNLIDISAPGQSIYATDNGGGYSAVSGTSFSAPNTAGVYALMISANPLLTSSQLDSFLFSSADDLGTPGKDKYHGYGRLDAEGAVALADQSADKTPPTVTLTAPAEGASVGGTVTLTASASDNVGVTRVEFYLDGQKIGEDTAGPFQFFWNSGLAANGTHSLTAMAWDAAGLDSLPSAVQVIVENTTETLNPPKEAYAYPDPATHGAVPILRAFFDDMDTLQINIYDVAGQTVESVEVPAVPAGVENGRLYYEWPWTGAIASGRYFALVCGKKGSEKSYVKTVVRVVR
ncbi:MAG: S8 family serine peptidase [Elusimicrobia bacterium]|nr:S8 family serine peptidase [Elusimicrobiota bacterium]